MAFIPAEQRAAAERVLNGGTRAELRVLSLKDFRQRPVLGLYTRQFRHLAGLAERMAQMGVDIYEADIQRRQKQLSVDSPPGFATRTGSAANPHLTG